MRIARAKVVAVLAAFVLTMLPSFATRTYAEGKFDAACEAQAQKKGTKLLRDVAEHIGGAPVSGYFTASDALLDYLTNPDPSRLDAAMHSLTANGAPIAFPEFGIVIKAGETLIGNAEKPGLPAQAVAALLQQSDNAEIDVMVHDFFDENAMVQKGITEDNYVKKVTNLDKLATLKSVWVNHYAPLQIAMNPGPQNEAETKRKLGAAWSQIEGRWKVAWAEVLNAQMREDLQRESLTFQEKLIKARCAAEANPPPSTGAAARWSGSWVDGPYNITVSGGGSAFSYTSHRHDDVPPNCHDCVPLDDEVHGKCTITNSSAKCTEEATYSDSAKEVKRSSEATLEFSPGATQAGDLISVSSTVVKSTVTLTSGQPCPDPAQCTGMHAGAKYSGTWKRKT